METTSEIIRRRVAAIVLLALMVGVAMLSVAMYQKAFTATETVTVQADRAGLQMRAGTVIKYKGVDVGKVKSAKPADDGTAVIELAMFPDMLDSIPADVEVSLEQLTAFGNKGVVLRPRGQNEDGQTVQATETLQAGATLTADHIAVEANQIFENLESVLQTAQPAKVYSVLTGLSTMLEGKGERLGTSLETADRYLRQINTDMPALERDFDRGADVLDIYSDASGDLLATLGNVTTTANTITDQQDELSTMFDAVTTFAEEGTSFTAANKDPLDNVLNTWLGTTDLLKRYSPMYSCFLQGAAGNWRLGRPVFGQTFPGLIATVGVIPQGGIAYETPQDLPDMSNADGPNCWTMPTFDGRTIPGGTLTKYDPGFSDENFRLHDTALSVDDAPLSVLVLGQLAEYVPGLAAVGGGR